MASVGSIVIYGGDGMGVISGERRDGGEGVESKGGGSRHFMNGERDAGDETGLRLGWDTRSASDGVIWDRWSMVRG